MYYDRNTHVCATINHRHPHTYINRHILYTQVVLRVFWATALSTVKSLFNILTSQKPLFNILNNPDGRGEVSIKARVRWLQGKNGAFMFLMVSCGVLFVNFR